LFETGVRLQQMLTGCDRVSVLAFDREEILKAELPKELATARASDRAAPMYN
jgi:hypothetical protein